LKRATVVSVIAALCVASMAGTALAGKGGTEGQPPRITTKRAKAFAKKWAATAYATPQVSEFTFGNKAGNGYREVAEYTFKTLESCKRYPSHEIEAFECGLQTNNVTHTYSIKTGELKDEGTVTGHGEVKVVVGKAGERKSFESKHPGYFAAYWLQNPWRAFVYSG
jgi:hypothetical protein